MAAQYTAEELALMQKINAQISAGIKLQETELELAKQLNQELGQKQNLTGPQATMKGVLETLVKTGQTGFETLVKMEGQEIKLAAAMGALKAPIQTIAAYIADLPSQLDTSFRDVVKSTGVYSKEMRDLFTYAMDPAAAERLGVVATSMEGPLKNIGLTTEEVGATLKGLTDNSMLFRKSFIAANMETSVYTANLVAGLAKIGVTSETSIKAIDQFTKGLRITPAEATKSIKSLVNIADSLEINVGQAMQDFTDMMPELAQWGNGAIDVFAKLEAQSVATGVSVNDLASFADNLDTFEGAATAAQGFNAVMGETLIDVDALVHADPAEKLAMFQDVMASRGVAFEDMDRRTQKVIASTLNFNSVLDAQKALGGGAEFGEQAAKVDKAAISQAQLEEKILSGMKASELASRSLSSLTHGMQTMVDFTRAAAAQGNDAIEDFSNNIMKGMTGDPHADFKTVGGMYMTAKLMASETGSKIVSTLGVLTFLKNWLTEAAGGGAGGASGKAGEGAVPGAGGPGAAGEGLVVPITVNMKGMQDQLLGTGTFVADLKDLMGRAITG